MLSTTYKKYTEDSSDITILDPRIIVFHNVVLDCKGYIDFTKQICHGTDGSDSDLRSRWKL
jgi:hypothetical protein